MGYWEKRVRKLEKEKDDSEQIGGCMALIFFVASLIVLALLTIDK